MTTEHTVVKPQKIVETFVGMLEQELLLPGLFQKESFDNYKGSEGDTVNFKVQGVLPFHEYGWRNDRSNPIVTDTLVQRKYPVTLGSNFYSAVEVTDEQADFDLNRWADLMDPQVKAVARGLNRKAAATMEDADYEVVVGDCAADLRGSLVEARRVLNLLHAPGDRYMVVGSNFEAELLSDEKLSLASSVGDAVAQTVLEEATLGRRSGFRIVVDQTIDPDAAYACAGSAFIFANAAPSVPASIKVGATTSFEGVSLRWMQDYDLMFLRDRNVINTYAGFRSVPDILVGWDADKNEEYVTTGQHLVRAIKLELDGASSYPAAGSDLAKAVGAPITAPGKQLKGSASTVADD